MPQEPLKVEEKSERIKRYAPVLAFILLIFILEIFHISKATSLVVSAVVSTIIFSAMAAHLQMKHKQAAQLTPIRKVVGLLNFMVIVIVGVAILHWYQIAHVNLRWILFFGVVLIYFIILFRGVHLYHEFLVRMEN